MLDGKTTMIESVIPTRDRSIGSMDVRRVLPFSKRRSVGPFVFVDDFGPIEIVNDESMDVLPHPHIGLSTVTYLFEGNMTHRDSIGSVQKIRPGEVNLMTAGSGIVHSERVSGSGNTPGTPLAGLQTWVALPGQHEEVPPSFSHTAKEELPLIEIEGAVVRVILGELFGERSPVVALGSPLYAECRAGRGTVLEIPDCAEERGIYLLSGAVSIGSERIGPRNLVVLSPGKVVEIAALESCVLMLLGGPRLERQRYMFWNFVSTSRDRIEAAKDDWRNRRFDAIPGEAGFIPLP